MDKTIAEQIKEVRAGTGMTQAAFAETFGIPKRSLENWEGGKRNPPEYVVSLLRMAAKNLQKD